MLSIRNLRLDFRINGVEKTPVEDVNLDLDENEIVVVVGKSGSGKSLTSLSALGLFKGLPGMTGGEVCYSDADLNFRVTPAGAECITADGIRTSGENALKTVRGKKISMIFQEHRRALNPLFTVKEHLCDTLLAHKKCDKKEAADEAAHWLEEVRICGRSDADKILEKYPCHLSGGQAQRLMTALALCSRPRILIADEPTTNLDASVQSSIINLVLGSLRKGLISSLLLITHDIRSIERILSFDRTPLRVVYFDRGKSVEEISVDKVDQLYEGWLKEGPKRFFEAIRRKHAV